MIILESFFTKLFIYHCNSNLPYFEVVNKHEGPNSHVSRLLTTKDFWLCILPELLEYSLSKSFEECENNHKRISLSQISALKNSCLVDATIYFIPVFHCRREVFQPTTSLDGEGKGEMDEKHILVSFIYTTQNRLIIESYSRVLYVIFSSGRLLFNMKIDRKRRKTFRISRSATWLQK